MRPFYTPHQLRHDHDDILFINEHWDEIKEAYFQVLEALKAPEGGCKCPWVKKTLIPTYFYITLDSTANGLTDTEVAEIIKNTEVTVITDEGFDNKTADIPKQFPLMYLGKTDEGYKYAFPYSMSDAEDSYSYPTGHEKYILIQLHNRLSQYNTENSSSVHGLTKTNGTRIYRDSGDKWPATNKIILSLAGEYRTIYSDLTSDIPQDTAKVYYYKHIDNGIEPVPMTFEFLETVRQCGTEIGDKPEETPKPPTPKPPTPETPDYTTPEGVVEGVLTPYTLKVKFKDTWYLDPGTFSLYCYGTKTRKYATKIVDDVVYFVFTEEEALTMSYVYFEKHEPVEVLTKESLTHSTFTFTIKFYDTIMDDVVDIEDNNYLHSYVPIGSAYI